MKSIDRRVIIAALMLIIVLAVVGKQLQQANLQIEEDQPIVAEIMEEDPELAAKTKIAVHVAGAVQHAGVYELEQGQRVEDALQLAGVNADSDVDALNRAAVLTDGQKIVVPSKAEAAAQKKDGAETDGLVDLNKASLEQLMALPGIGPVKAQSIVDYRQQQGSFQSIEEVQQVNGIGEALFTQIKNKIKV